MSRRKSRTDRRRSRAERLRPLAGLLAIGLSAPALAGGSVPFPTYQTGPQKDGSWVVGDGQIITPAGIQVDLGKRVRAKAVALNPAPGSHTAAVLLLGASQAVEVFDTRTGELLQTYSSNQNQDSSGSYSGIAYSADGKYLVQPGQQLGRCRHCRAVGPFERRRLCQRAAEQQFHQVLPE